MEFNAALDRAIDVSHRRTLVLGVAMAVFGPGVLLLLWFGVGGWNLLLLLQVLIPVFVVTATVLAALWRRRAKTADLLTKLRGAQLPFWLESPSHGVVLLTDTHVLSGGVPPASFDRHADCRLTSTSYDEEAHAMTLDVTEIHRSNDNERESQNRSLVKLATSVTRERAHAFAREARERNRH